MRESINFDRIADRYEQTRGGLARGERVAGWLTSHLTSGRRTLEIGVGTGVVATAMRRAGFDVVGIDLSTKMLARAQERIGPRVACADAGRLPFPDGSVPQVYSAWVLHLVGDPLAVLAEVARVLVPGGCYVDVPGSDAGEQDAVGEAIGDMAERLRERAWSEARTADGVAALAPRAGLTVTEMRLAGSHSWTRTPSEAADAIRSRAFSYLWDVDDATWAAIVEPVLARLDALPDEPVSRTSHDRVVVMRKA